MTRSRRWAMLTLAAIVLAAACGGGESQPTATPGPPVGSAVPQNLFPNGSFEEGPDPWFSLDSPAWGTPFHVTDTVAHSGRRSALLEMRAGPGETGARVFGVVQEIEPDEFPELISGYYRVEDWLKGTEKQYLQFVVIVWGPANFSPASPNYQIRFPLAGIDEEPFNLSNAHFQFVTKEQPVTDQWVYFERNIRDDFQRLWGAVPEGFSSIRILFEVRYDDKSVGTALEGNAYYDDLYVGPAAGNPNAP
jgi:hypothetical protein